MTPSLADQHRLHQVDAERLSLWSHNRLLAQVREVGLDLLALLWPTNCLGCHTADRLLCDTCVAEIRSAQGEVHEVHTAAGVAAVAGPYDGPLRAVLVAFKHESMTRFGKLLGAQLRAPLWSVLEQVSVASESESQLSRSRSATEQHDETREGEVSQGARGHGRGHALRDPLVVVTVPSRPARVRERGYRHVDVLVRAALHGRPARRRAAYLLPRVLRTTRGRRTQVGLSDADRMLNAARVRVAAGMAKRVRGRDVVLVDDIITTGATVAAAAAALEAVGANVVGIAALCGVERRSESHRVSREKRTVNLTADNELAPPEARAPQPNSRARHAREHVEHPLGNLYRSDQQTRVVSEFRRNGAPGNVATRLNSRRSPWMSAFEVEESESPIDSKTMWVQKPKKLKT